MKRFLILTLTLFLVIAFKGNAQIITEEDFSLVITPETYKAGDTITVELQSFSVDVDRVGVVWRYDGKIIANGTGKKIVQIKVPGSDLKLPLVATITISGQTTFEKEVRIGGTDIELFYEGLDSYSPPFYKGKIFPSPEAMVRATAFPNDGKTAKQLSYRWSRNSELQPTVSGYGKAGFLFKGDYTKNQDEIEVLAQRSGSEAGSGSTLLTYQSPFVLFYKKINGFIHYEEAVAETSSMDTDTMTFVAEPYAFSVPTSIEKNLSIIWKLGGNDAVAGDRKNELVVTKSNASGSTLIEAAVANVSKFFQSQKNDFKLIF